MKIEQIAYAAGKLVWGMVTDKSFAALLKGGKIVISDTGGIHFCLYNRTTGLLVGKTDSIEVRGLWELYKSVKEEILKIDEIQTEVLSELESL